MKNGRGITLISLVITIIVLLILAAVSIGMLFGENGILVRANEASEETNKAKAEEEVKLAILGSYDKTGKVNEKYLVEELYKISDDIKTNSGVTITEGSTTVSEYPIKVIVGNQEIIIKDNHTISIVGEAEVETESALEALIRQYDVNGDGELTKEDSEIILSYLSSSVGEIDIDEEKADADGDGEISSGDALAVLKKVEEYDYIKYDINGDGDLTKEDSDIILSYLSSSVGEIDIDEEKADVDGDGEISSGDALAVLKKVEEYNKL